MYDPRVREYMNLYEAQDGGAIDVYSGTRFQRGSGWFGRLIGTVGNFIKSIAAPAAKKALPSAIGLAQDILQGENVGQSSLKRLKEAGKNVADETLEQLKNKLQGGKGMLRPMLDVLKNIQGSGIPRRTLPNRAYKRTACKKKNKNNKKIKKKKLF